jgi:hypothetical protein
VAYFAAFWPAELRGIKWDDGFILQNGSGKPLSLHSLNMRVITPAMQKAGIPANGASAAA